MAATARYIRVAGINTYVIEAGKGPWLLLLPSPLIMARTYDCLIARLAAHFRVVCPDMPGGGHSARLPAPWSFHKYAEWTNEFMSTMGIEKALVIGHSNSGGVGLALAALYPHRVGGLILADSVGGRTRHSTAGVIAARLLDGLREIDLNARSWPDLVYNVLFHRKGFVYNVLGAVRAELFDYAAAVHAPTLLAWGRRDITMPLVSAFRLRALIPRSRLYLSEGSHDWCLTNLDEFTGVVVRFHRAEAFPAPAPDVLNSRAGSGRYR